MLIKHIESPFNGVVVALVSIQSLEFSERLIGKFKF